MNIYIYFLRRILGLVLLQAAMADEQYRLTAELLRFLLPPGQHDLAAAGASPAGQRAGPARRAGASPAAPLPAAPTTGGWFFSFLWGTAKPKGVFDSQGVPPAYFAEYTFVPFPKHCRWGHLWHQ